MADFTGTWYGKPFDQLTREEMLDALNHCAAEIASLRGDRLRWQRAADPLKYLLNGEQK